jgi:hypothetical protein
MDVLTARGQLTLVDERIAANAFSRATRIEYVRTPDDQPAKADAVLVRDGRLIGLVETKCRYDLTLEQFRSRFANEWLVTMDKIESSKALAAGLCVPLYGFLFLVSSGVLLTKKIAGADGQYECKFRVDRTETQATVNGGRARRVNAFINMAGATEFPVQAGGECDGVDEEQG